MTPETEFSGHARQRMVERGISEVEVEEAIRKGTKRPQDGKLVSAYHYFEVVYRIRGKKNWVITVQSRW